jgi:hypothetical protein
MVIRPSSEAFSDCAFWLGSAPTVVCEPLCSVLNSVRCLFLGFKVQALALRPVLRPGDDTGAVDISGECPLHFFVFGATFRSCAP